MGKVTIQKIKERFYKYLDPMNDKSLSKKEEDQKIRKLKNNNPRQKKKIGEPKGYNK